MLSFWLDCITREVVDVNALLVLIESVYECLRELEISFEKEEIQLWWLQWSGFKEQFRGTSGVESYRLIEAEYEFVL